MVPVIHSKKEVFTNINDDNGSMLRQYKKYYLDVLVLVDHWKVMDNKKN
jgi:hypothetical protein